MIKFFRAYMAFREYRKRYIEALKKALLELDTARQSVMFVNLKQEDAFMWYTKVMDCSEEAMKIASDLAKTASINEKSNPYVKREIVYIARVYEQASKVYAFVGAALSVIGGFQPTRAREMLEAKVEYPLMENTPTR